MSRSILASLLVLTIASFSHAEQPPFSPRRSAERIQLPDGFRVTLFAGEPDVIKPIAMTLDDRGRLWVVESHSYPDWLPEGKQGHDRILIFEDKKGSGHFDSCKVFWDKGTNLSGIAVGFGGVWLCAAPNLLFVPVHPGEDKPASAPKAVLDGWDCLKAKHNVFSNLTWGPDGWLYGCNGIQATSHIGRPGTPQEKRVALNCGVWRYHPVKDTFETFAWGTTNPWGLDFDDYGEMFITNCVIKHLFHVVQGAHFVRMYGQDLNPNCYGLMASCADHIHWGGGHWSKARGGTENDAAGGGHAHVGAMVYLGDNWPDEYRNHIFMCNLHGNRVNQDVLERHGSGYVAHHGKDFLMAHDSWFRGLSLLCGPDGGVFVSDWHDTGECHDYDRVEPCGRIYKVTFGKPAAVNPDLSAMSDAQLVRLQLHKNDWWVRHARRLLQERAHAGKLDKDVRRTLRDMLDKQTEVTRKLRALWALHVTGPLDEKTLLGLLDSEHAEIRVWAVRLMMEDKRISDDAAKRLAELARSDKAASVRLSLVSALQRLPLKQRWDIAEGLAGHAEDAADDNLPLMTWYGIEPLVPDNPDRAAKLLVKCRIPLVRQYIARRIASLASPLVSLVLVLDDGKDTVVHLDVLHGMHEALQGQRNATAPEGWSNVYRELSGSTNAEVREKVLQLSVLFGDPQALAVLHQRAADPKADAEARQSALQTLIEKRPPDLVPLLQKLIGDRGLRGLALRGLASYSDPETPALILEHYSSFTDAEKTDAVATLASRPKYALTLLDAMEKGRVPRRDLSAFTVRQLLAFKDKNLSERLTKVWGSIRPPSQEKAAQLAKYKAMTPADALKKADRNHGRLLFSRTCANCHTLFGEGGKIGPDLTGSQRTNPEYLLTKLLDPSAVVARDYQMTVIITKSGRTLSGLIKEESEKTLALQTQNEVVRVEKTDIEERNRSSQSMMPDGLLAMLSPAEVRNLIAYLSGPGQVPLPPEPRK
jgi:putative membrane-bound dehydrogenase-like protein